MTEPTRAKAGRRPRRSASQLFIAALVVFGIAASVLLLFSENIQWLRVGLVSALWAAILGAFAMTKYRRDAVADQAKAKDLQTVYELQLAREIAARREYELGVEARVRSEVQLETSEIAALRAELAQLRSNLQMLFEGNLPTERVALRAESIRMQELGGGRNYDSYQPAPSGLYIPGRGGNANANGADAAASSANSDGLPEDNGVTDVEPIPGLATPYDEPVTAETSVLYPDVPIGSEPPPGYTPSRPIDAELTDPGPVSGRGPTAVGQNGAAAAAVGQDGAAAGRRVPTPPRAYGPGPNAVTPPRPSGSFGRPQSAPEPRSAPEPQTAPEPQSAPEPAPEPQPVAESQPAVEPQPYSGGTRGEAVDETPDQAAAVEPRSRRRRREGSDSADTSGAHSNGRSVAEIMAEMQSGSAAPAERRHRRRAD